MGTLSPIRSLPRKDRNHAGMMRITNRDRAGPRSWAGPFFILQVKATKVAEKYPEPGLDEEARHGEIRGALLLS